MILSVCRYLAAQIILSGVLFWGLNSAWAMDLLQVYLSALEQNPNILASRANTDASRERITQARAQLLPNISASYTRGSNDLSRKNPSIFQTPDEQYISDNRVLTLRQPLLRMYQWAQYRQVGFQFQAAKAELEKDLQDLASQVVGAYFEALLSDENLALILTQKGFYAAQLDAARKGFSAGIGTRTDIDEAQARLDMNIAQELEARQNQQYSREQLQIMLNTPIDTLAVLDLNKVNFAPPDPPDFDTWRSLAEAYSPEYQTLKAQRDAAAAALDMARAGRYPTVDLIAQYSKSLSDNINTINSEYSNRLIGVQMSIPIFSSGSVGASIRQAQFVLENANQTLDAKRRDIGLRVQREFHNVTEGILKIRALEQAERSATQMVASNRKSFEAGLRTRLDILNAEQEKMSVLSNLARQRYLYLISHIRLLALAGKVTRERIEEMNSWLLHGQQ